MEDMREESRRSHSEIGVLGEAAAPAYEQAPCCSAVPYSPPLVSPKLPRSGVPRAGQGLRRETRMEVEVEVEVVYAAEGRGSSSDSPGCSSSAAEGALPEYGSLARALYVPRSLARKS